MIPCFGFLNTSNIILHTAIVVCSIVLAISCRDNEITFLRSAYFFDESRVVSMDFDGDLINETTAIWYKKYDPILFACFWKPWVVEDGMEDYAYLLAVDFGKDGKYEVVLYDLDGDGVLETPEWFVDPDSLYDALQGRDNNIVQHGADAYGL